MERTLRLGAKMPRSEYPKDEVRKLELQIQKILGAINTPSTPPDENLGVGERVPRSVSITRCGATANTVPESGTLLAPPVLSCSER